MDPTNHTNYPFSAIVGQDDMKLALCLIAVQPAIGGVLIYGERGTAKTTAVRALPSLLGNNTRVIELPLNASEDRVVGTLRLDTLMQSGEREFVPGLMAEADGNILYVDEINLLEDSIVDLLLDAAATGVCRIEREGISMKIPARFVLIGTMNPEEGALRPQLLDRFGLSVKVSGNLSREERITLIQRLTELERDPASFSDKWHDQEAQLSERIRHAAEIYPDVVFSDEMAAYASDLCAEFSIDGYSGDISMIRTARAAAALDSRTDVTTDDILTAARFVLPHRLKRLPFEDMGMNERMLQKASVILHNEVRKTEVKNEPGASEDNSEDSAKKV